jgi:hypothetical protein
MFAATGIGGVVYGARAWMPELASRHGAGIDAMLTYLLISAFRSGILLMLIVPFALVAIVGTLAVRRFRQVPYNRLLEIKEVADGAAFGPRHSGGPELHGSRAGS